jgi:hypothetical protein
MKRTEANEQHDEPNAFRRFEDLTKRLLSVSKREADDKAAQQKRRNNTKPR